MWVESNGVALAYPGAIIYCYFTAWVLQKFQAALEFDRKLDGVTGVTWLEWAKAVGSIRGYPACVIKKNSNSVQHLQNSIQFFFKSRLVFQNIIVPYSIVSFNNCLNTMASLLPDRNRLEIQFWSEIKTFVDC